MVLIGAVVLTLTALYVVSPLKGQPIPALWPRFYYALLVNGAWGFGTALFLGARSRRRWSTITSFRDGEGTGPADRRIGLAPGLGARELVGGHDRNL